MRATRAELDFQTSIAAALALSPLPPALPHAVPATTQPLIQDTLSPVQFPCCILQQQAQTQARHACETASQATGREPRKTEGEQGARALEKSQ